MSMKNPMTPAGIEPATFRFVVQHLNHCATAVHLQCTFGNTVGIAFQIIKQLLVALLRFPVQNV